MTISNYLLRFINILNIRIISPIKSNQNNKSFQIMNDQNYALQLPPDGKYFPSQQVHLGNGFALHSVQ